MDFSQFTPFLTSQVALLDGIALRPRRPNRFAVGLKEADRRCHKTHNQRRRNQQD